MSEFAEGYAVGQGNANANCCGWGGWNPWGAGMFGGMGGFGLGGWGGDSLAILLLFALFANGGWGGGFNGGGNNVFGEVQRGFDTSGINNKLNGIENGLCDGFYAQNTNTLTGFSNVQQTLCQGFSGVNATVNAVGNQINQGICNLGYNIQGGFNEVSRQIGDCCCQTQRGIDGINYNLASQACNIQQAIDKVGDRVIDRMNQQETAQLRDQVQYYRMRELGMGYVNDVVDRVNPCPRPMYPVCNPNTPWNGWNGDGCRQCC